MWNFLFQNWKNQLNVAANCSGEASSLIAIAHEYGQIAPYILEIAAKLRVIEAKIRDNVERSQRGTLSAYSTLFTNQFVR